MNILKDKKKLIQVLFGLAFILLVANILINKLQVKHYTPVESSVSGAEINAKYMQALKNYGLLNQWITKKRKNKRDDDSLLFKYNVEVPRDLPIALLVNEITDSLDNQNVKIQSNEINIGGKTELKIFSGDNLKLQSDFNYNDRIERKAGKRGLIISGAGDLGEDDFNSLLKSPERFAVLLVPSKNSGNRISRILNDQKEMLVLIGDESNDMNYKMRAGFSAGRIRNSIRAIVSDYSSAAFFILDDGSRLYQSTAMSLIKNLLDRGGVKYIKLSECARLLQDSDAGMRKQFDSFAKKITDGNKRLILLSPDELSVVVPELLKFRKIGYKFVRASVIIADSTDKK